MFGFLKNNGANGNPLDSLKNITRWIKNLPVGDITSAQKSVVEKLAEFNGTRQDYSHERLAVLRGLDEQCREMQAILCAQYLRNPRMSRLLEARLWSVIQGFYLEVARGYHAFLMHLVAKPGAAKLQSQLPLITARALRAMADVLKWRYFHFERIDEKLWLRLHNLHRMAEFNAYADQNLAVYENDPRQSSCREEYLQALLLSYFGIGSLPPRQIEMIDTWLDQWAGLTRLQTQYDPQFHGFFVDIEQGQGLRRLRNPDQTPTWRYVSTVPLRAKIDEVKALLKKGKSPASLGLGEDFRSPEGLVLLDHVSDEWAPMSSRERRGQRREARQGRWEVVRDLNNIFILLLTSSCRAPGGLRTTLSAEEILDLKLYGFVTERTRENLAKTTIGTIPAEHRARWLQLDESEHGIGFAVSGVGLNWAKTGRLLAMRREGIEDAWQIGVLRRILATDSGHRVFGVHLLESQFECIDIEQEAETSDPELVRTGYVVHDATHGPGYIGYALLLTDPDNTRSLMLESARYGHGREYLIRLADGNTQLIQLDAVQEKGEGWLKAGYRVLAAS